MVYLSAIRAFSCDNVYKEKWLFLLNEEFISIGREIPDLKREQCSYFPNMEAIGFKFSL